jgi:integrase
MTKRLSKWIENGRSKLANNKNEYMFPSRERALFDRHITEASIKTRFYNYCRDAGLPSYYSVHHLRSSSAILWAKRGKSPIEIMRWLRLKSLICVKRYFDRHEFKEMNSEAHDVFEKYL